MKTRITILLIVISVLSILLPLTPVQAAASMSPGSGTVGTYVAISGLTASDSYLIKWDGTNIRSGTVPSGGSVFFTTFVYSVCILTNWPIRPVPVFARRAVFR